MSNRVALSRLKKELEMLYREPPPGISAWAKGDDSFEIEAVIRGADDTPYAEGSFKLSVTMPQRYPFEPPKVHFVTPIYHPNIDSAGRICLDILNMPPKGAWKPSLNLSSVLSSIQLLMSHPNPDDGLMLDITHEYTHFPAQFKQKAIERTKRFAVSIGTETCGSDQAKADQGTSGAESNMPDALPNMRDQVAETPGTAVPAVTPAELAATSSRIVASIEGQSEGVPAVASERDALKTIAKTRAAECPTSSPCGIIAGTGTDCPTKRQKCADEPL